MLLALSIVSEQGAALGSTAYKVFDERGGSIGRVAGNDWVLPDSQNFVSSRHARVMASDGVFYVEDTSSNGTFINAPDCPAARGERQPLRDGDRLFIGDYEIIVQLIAETAPPASAPPVGATALLEALEVEPSRSDAGNQQLTFHQAAMRAGVRAGFNAMLARLHPQKLEELYERKLKRTALLGVGNKAKYWELFRAEFEEIDRDREAHFQRLFGEAFAHAYNEHLQKLVSEARLRNARGSP